MVYQIILMGHKLPNRTDYLFLRVKLNQYNQFLIEEKKKKKKKTITKQRRRRK